MSVNASALGGGLAANELFQRALSDLDVERRARDAGVKDQPAANSSTLDSNEREFVTYFTEKLRNGKRECEETLSQLALDRTATSAKIDIAQTRSALAGLFNALAPDLARLKQDHQQSLEQAKDQEARSLRYLRHFQQEHDLQNRAADPHPSPLMHFALVAVFAVVEWVSLSIFYAEGSDFGLLGGILMAMALSVINIVLAVFVGAVLRYLNHKSLTRNALAVVAAAFLTAMFLLATVYAAHYRTAVREIAAESSSQPIVVRPDSKAASEGGIPIATPDDDQWRASRLAWQHFRENGFVFHDVLSWLLVILALIFGIVASWKGYGIDDRYPGYGPTYRRYMEDKAAYDEVKKAYTQAVDDIFKRAGDAQQALLRDVRKNIEYFQDLARKSDTVSANYLEGAKQLQQTCNDVIFRYRDINGQVATRAAPRYFSEPVMLDDSLMRCTEPLTSAERHRLAEYEAAIREFTNLVQTDDARRQSMRADYLEKLSEFFEKIERAINEKLAKEAQLYKA